MSRDGGCRDRSRGYPQGAPRCDLLMDAFPAARRTSPRPRFMPAIPSREGPWSLRRVMVAYRAGANEFA